jgi:hypothetical protein
VTDVWEGSDAMARCAGEWFDGPVRSLMVHLRVVLKLSPEIAWFDGPDPADPVLQVYPLNGVHGANGNRMHMVVEFRSAAEGIRVRSGGGAGRSSVQEMAGRDRPGIVAAVSAIAEELLGG